MPDWFTGLFTPEGLIQFCLGAGAACVYQWVKAKLQGRKVVFRWVYLALPLAVGAVLYIAIQNQQNADCVREFNNTLRERTKISDDQARWSTIQDKAFGDWFKTILAPPADMLELRQNDPGNPVYQQWVFETTEYYSGIVQRTQEEQRRNNADRARHPLPPPTCGIR